MITIWDLLYSLKFTLTAVMYIAGERNPRASFHLIDDDCLTSAITDTFFGLQTVIWNAVCIYKSNRWCEAHPLVLCSATSSTWSPCFVTRFVLLVGTSTCCALHFPMPTIICFLCSMWYHVLSWPVSLLASGLVAQLDLHERVMDHTCWIRSEAAGAYVFEGPLAACLVFALCSLLYAGFRLKSGTRASRQVRSLLFKRHSMYTLAFMVLWLFPMVHYLVDNDDRYIWLTLADSISASGQAFIFAVIRLSEPGARMLLLQQLGVLHCVPACCLPRFALRSQTTGPLRRQRRRTGRSNRPRHHTAAVQSVLAASGKQLQQDLQYPSGRRPSDADSVMSHASDYTAASSMYDGGASVVSELSHDSWAAFVAQTPRAHTDSPAPTARSDIHTAIGADAAPSGAPAQLMRGFGGASVGGGQPASAAPVSTPGGRDGLMTFFFGKGSTGERSSAAPHATDAAAREAQAITAAEGDLVSPTHARGPSTGVGGEREDIVPSHSGVQPLGGVASEGSGYSALHPAKGKSPGSVRGLELNERTLQGHDSSTQSSQTQDNSTLTDSKSSSSRVTSRRSGRKRSKAARAKRSAMASISASVVRTGSQDAVGVDAINSIGTGWDITAGLRAELGMCMLSGLCQTLLHNEAVYRSQLRAEATQRVVASAVGPRSGASSPTASAGHTAASSPSQDCDPRDVRDAPVRLSTSASHGQLAALLKESASTEAAPGRGASARQSSDISALASGSAASEGPGAGFVRPALKRLSVTPLGSTMRPHVGMIRAHDGAVDRRLPSGKGGSVAKRRWAQERRLLDRFYSSGTDLNDAMDSVLMFAAHMPVRPPKDEVGIIGTAYMSPHPPTERQAAKVPIPGADELVGVEEFADLPCRATSMLLAASSTVRLHVTMLSRFRVSGADAEAAQAELAKTAHTVAQRLQANVDIWTGRGPSTHTPGELLRGFSAPPGVSSACRLGGSAGVSGNLYSGAAGDPEGGVMELKMDLRQGRVRSSSGVPEEGSASALWGSLFPSSRQSQEARAAKGDPSAVGMGEQSGRFSWRGHPESELIVWNEAEQRAVRHIVEQRDSSRQQVSMHTHHRHNMHHASDMPMVRKKPGVRDSLQDAIPEGSQGGPSPVESTPLGGETPSLLRTSIQSQAVAGQQARALLRPHRASSGTVPLKHQVAAATSSPPQGAAQAKQAPPPLALASVFHRGPLPKVLSSDSIASTAASLSSDAADAEWEGVADDNTPRVRSQLVPREIRNSVPHTAVDMDGTAARPRRVSTGAVRAPVPGSAAKSAAADAARAFNLDQPKPPAPTSGSLQKDFPHLNTFGHITGRSESHDAEAAAAATPPRPSARRRQHTEGSTDSDMSSCEDDDDESPGVLSPQLMMTAPAQQASFGRALQRLHLSRPDVDEPLLSQLWGASDPAAPASTSPPPKRDNASSDRRKRSLERQNSGSPLETFEIVSVADEAFAMLRRAAGLSTAHIVSMFDPHALRLGLLKAHFSDAGSSSFFCRSLDQSLVVKTIESSEMEVLLHLLPAYMAHLRGNPSSLLCRFYGCFGLQMAGSKRVWFLLMGNVFPCTETGTNTETYDLKGSTVGRKARLTKSLESRDSSGRTVRHGVLFQDTDLRNHYPEGLPVLSDTTSKCLSRQLTRDARLLAAHGIMDYSLLLNVVPTGRPRSIGSLKKRTVAFNDRFALSRAPDIDLPLPLLRKERISFSQGSRIVRGVARAARHPLWQAADYAAEEAERHKASQLTQVRVQDDGSATPVHGEAPRQRRLPWEWSNHFAVTPWSPLALLQGTVPPAPAGKRGLGDTASGLEAPLLDGAAAGADHGALGPGLTGGEGDDWGQASSASLMQRDHVLLQVGMIDMLQTYDTGKRLEKGLKMIRHADMHVDVSSIDPQHYLTRFIMFMRQTFTLNGQQDLGGR